MAKINTDRLILRQIEEVDKNELKQLIFDSKVVAYVRYRRIKTDEEFNDIFSNHFLNNPEVFGIVSRETLRLIGFFEFHFDSDEPNITYALGQNSWGKGYASEAGIPLLNYAFDNFNINELYGYHAEANPNSGKVMQKMGMNFVEKWDEVSSVDGTPMTIYKYKIEKD